MHEGRDAADAAEQETAARLAGWTPDMGPMPSGHGLPPDDDPALGNNGVPAPVPGDPDYVGGAAQ